MKKLFVVLACVGMLAGMVSCKKVCKCYDATGTLSIDEETPVADLTKEQCKTLNTAYSLFGGKCKMEAE